MDEKNQLKLGIQPFWFWNGAMDKEEIIRQITAMKEQGMKGFIIHPRQGMDIPYLSEAYFERIDLAVRQAYELDMEVWLYDEYPYPSGVAAGQVTLDHPEYRCRKLEMTAGRSGGRETVMMDLPWGNILSAKAYPFKAGQTDWGAGIDISEYIGTSYAEEVFQLSGLTRYNHKRYFTGNQIRRLWWEAPGGEWQIYIFTEVVMTGFKYFNTYVDTMNPKAVRHYLDTTHERYKKRFGEAWGTIIKGIFTDEVTAFPPEQPWSPLLPKLIREKTGFQILDYLPVLFGISMGEITDQVLYAYWNTCSDAFEESYDRQVQDWCHKNGIRFIGEKPILRSKELEFIDCPGIDAGHQKVGEKPLTAPPKYRANAKMAASAKHFYDKEAVLCEAFHSIGWGMTLQDMKWTLDWLAVQGIDWFVIHAFFYTTDGLKKHDAPPSAFYQMPWWKDMHLLSSYADRLVRMNRLWKRCVSVLLVDPVTSLWTAGKAEKTDLQNAFSRLQTELLKNRLDYYIIDPQLLAESRVCRDGQDTVLIVGDYKYHYVVLPPMSNMEDGCFNTLRLFAESGGIVAAVGQLADRVIMEQQPGGWMREWFLTDYAHGIYGLTPEELCEKLRGIAGGYYLESADGEDIGDILSAEYEDENGQRRYFIVNTSRRQRVLKGSIIHTTWTMTPLESAVCGLDENGYLIIQEQTEASYEIALDQTWKLELYSCNMLRLGRWRLLVKETGSYSTGYVEPMPVIDQLEKGRMMVPVELRKQFGCPKTLLLPRGTYIYKTEFEITDDEILKYPVRMVMEPSGISGDWSVGLNGHELGPCDFTEAGQFLPDNLECQVNKYLTVGKNLISVQVMAGRTFDGIRSPLYLAGKFGVEVLGDSWRLIRLPETGIIKDAIADKIPYYAGVAVYSSVLELQAPAPGKRIQLFIRDTWLQDSVELIYNDCSLGVCAWAPYRWMVPDYLFKEGTNQVALKIANSMLGLFEGQYFDRDRQCYESYQGNSTVIEDYEAVVAK